MSLPLESQHLFTYVRLVSTNLRQFQRLLWSGSNCNLFKSQGSLVIAPSKTREALFFLVCLPVQNRSVRLSPQPLIGLIPLHSCRSWSHTVGLEQLINGQNKASWEKAGTTNALAESCVVTTLCADRAEVIDFDFNFWLETLLSL